MPDYGGIELADETTTPLAVPGVGRPGRAAAGPSRAGRSAGAGAAPGLVRPHPYLQAERRGLARQRRALPRLLAGGRRASPAPSVPTCCTSTTGTPAPRWPPSTARSRRVLSIHNLAYQGVTRRGLADPASGRAPSTTSGGAARTRCRARSPSPTRSWPCRRTTPARSSRRRAGSALDGPLRHRWDARVGHPQRHRHRRCGTRPPTPTCRRTTRRRRRRRRGWRPRRANRAEVRRRAGFADDDVPLAVDGDAAHRPEGHRPAAADRPAARADPAARRRARLGRAAIADAARPRPRRATPTGSRSSRATTRRSPTCCSAPATCS